MAKQNAIELKKITKFFGEIVANRDVDFSVRRGEILALLGENGSGKTTLMNMLSGIYKPNGGEIFVNGERVEIHSPEDAKKLGIGMVHQHFKLVESLSAADNIAMGDDRQSFFLTRTRFRKAQEICREYGFDLDVRKHVCEMSVSEKQNLEILKVLYYGADILILDEPTAVLTPQETQRLFQILRNMRDKGCAIIIITHKLNEVLELSDRVTVLRRGESVGTVKTADADAQSLAELMVGHKVSFEIERPKLSVGEKLLQVYDLAIQNEDGALVIDDLSFSLSEYEILGVAGIAGSGQKELCEAIAGLYPIDKGAILYRKENVEGKTPRERISLGISMSFIPEDRLGMGLAASLDIVDNMMLKNYGGNKLSPFVDRKRAAKTAQEVVETLQIVTPSLNTPIRKLSGGNVQKVLLGREISANPKVLITAYPVRGLDINSSYTIYNLLNEQKACGAGILFIGEDLDVMLELCDRILVLSHGRCTGIVSAREATKEQIGILMTQDPKEIKKEAAE